MSNARSGAGCSWPGWVAGHGAVAGYTFTVGAEAARGPIPLW
jgi:hypothetical protein